MRADANINMLVLSITEIVVEPHPSYPGQSHMRRNGVCST